MRWAEIVTRTRELDDHAGWWMEKLEGKKSLGRPSLRW
jgi:hypothetical protein